MKANYDITEPLNPQCVVLAVRPLSSRPEHGCLIVQQTDCDLLSAERRSASGRCSSDHWWTM